MALPEMPSGIASREYLRVGGGLGSAAAGDSPAGGLDIDHAGRLATDGDVTVKGALSVGTLGQLQADAAGNIQTAGNFSASGSAVFQGGFGFGGTLISGDGVFTDHRLQVGGSGEALLNVITGATVAQCTLTTPTGNGGAEVQFDANPADGASVSYISFFRNTSTTGSRRLRILPGNGGSSPTLEIDAASGTLMFHGSMGNSSRNPAADAPADWVQVSINGTVRYLPAYAA